MMQASPFQAKAPSKTVAVVVPLSNRPELTADESISLRHLLFYLGGYKVFLVAPKHLRVSIPDFEIVRFPGKFFGSAKAHGRMLSCRKFYERFADYKYILIYHLDSLVFSDQLLQWCEADLDYIGAPWFNCPDSPWVEVPRVGNGGFTLMKIESVLKVFDSPLPTIDPREYWEKYYANRPKLDRYLSLPKRYLKYLPTFNSSRWHLLRMQQADINNDYFWADEAVRYYPAFKVASFEQGLQFAFEVSPRICFEMNHRRLPFGCHAWPKYDRGFWEPHLLKEALNKPMASNVDTHSTR
jgi:hypothetical protein